MSVYETSPVQQTDESETTITLVFPKTTRTYNLPHRSKTAQPVDESETTIAVVFPSVIYTCRLVAVAQVPTEGRGLQEMGPSNPSELVVSSFC